MSMEETSATTATPLVTLGDADVGDADAEACADGFCAVPSAPTGAEPGGTGE
jgi:hypothetical protein